MKLPFRDYHLLEILKKYSKQFYPLDVFLKNYFRSNKSIGSKDRRIICDNVYGIMRWQGLLDYLSNKPHTWEKRLEVYKNFNYEAHLVNPSIPEHVKVSFPKYYFELISKIYGSEKAKEICLICNHPAPVFIRVNLLKTQREDLLKNWKDSYDISLCNVSKSGLHFKNKINFFSLEEFKKGLFEVQDEGSQVIASLVKAKPKELVLDYCAGSGGKSLAFAHQMQNQGQIFLHDIRENALAQAKKRLKRAGIQNAQIKYPNSSGLNTLENKMDWVLLDVPCSGSGTLRRNPDMKWKFDLTKLKNLVKIQKEIFDEAFKYLNKNGKIVYATCSIFTEENIEQINYFIKKYDLKLVEKPHFWLPQKNGMDGFFGAVLTRS